MVKKFDVYFCAIRGNEKPCIVISPDEMNEVLPYVLIAPITAEKRNFPCRVGVKLKGQEGQVALDLMRSMPKDSLVRRVGSLPVPLQDEIQNLLKDFLINR